MRLSCLIFAGIAIGAKSQTPAGCDFEAALRQHQAGELAQAAEGYRACITADPGRVDARANLGAVLAKMGRYEEAIAQDREALRVAPAEVIPNLRLNLALAYYKSFQIPAAAAELENLHSAQPDNLNIALLLADCRLRMGEYQKAVEVAAPLEPSHPDDAGLAYVLGMALIREGKVAEGQVRVDRILSRGDSAEGHFLLGSALFGAGNYPGALAELNRAAVLNPEVPSLQSYLGQALLFTGDADAAIQAFRKELAANPNDFEANYYLASILANRGQAAESRTLLERAAQVRPGSAEVQTALAKGFHFEAPAGNDPGILPGTAAPPIGSLKFTGMDKPVVLVFGSYTCPKLRGSAADLKRIATRYHNRVAFRLVYISEAHASNAPASEWQSSINEREGVDLPPARDLAEKRDHATLCVRKLELPFAVVVDGMDTAAERAYQAWPSRLYLVGRDGRIAWQTRLGELDFHADQLEQAIRETLGSR